MNKVSISKKEKIELINDFKMVELVSSSNGVIPLKISKDILKVTRTSSTVLMKYKDKEIKTFSTFSDYYGYETSIQNAITEAQELLSYYNIEDSSGLVLSVQTEVSESFYLKSTKENEGLFIPNNFILDLNQLDVERLVFLTNKEYRTKTDEEFDEIYELNKKLKITESRIISVFESWNSLKKHNK